MHSKILASLLITFSILHSQDVKNEKFQLIAKDVTTQDNIVIAKGDVVIFSPTYYFSADKVIYNKEKDTYELFDNVFVVKENKIQTQSNYAFIDLKKDSIVQSPLFLMETNQSIWMNSKDSKKLGDKIDLGKSIMSSCDCDDPLWSIKMSSGDYDSKAKWVNAYNTRLYFKAVPVMYSPYMGFSTDTTRRSGLLVPTMGYSRSEGLYYAQPIYFAPADNYDLEFIPQVRNRRGYGEYTYFRYADSPYSTLKMQTGGFKEKKDYQIKNSLKNQKHYGWNVDYNRSKLFSNGYDQDGLFTSLNWMNDIEYKTLEKEEDNISTDKNVESKINYFYNTPEYYYGMYARYYVDTSKESNDATMQELPQLHFHDYYKQTSFDNILYSLDTKAYNYTRKDGITARIYELTAPLSYTKYFMDDYLYLTLENKTTISKYDYSNTSSNIKDGNLIQNESSVSTGTDLIKPYGNYTHTVNLNAKYSIPKNLEENGDLYKITTDTNSSEERELSYFPIAEKDKNINLSLNQSVYGQNSLKQIVNHKMSQSILYNQLNEAEFQDYKNYAKFNHDFGSVSGKVVYNMQDNELVESTADTTFDYKKGSVTLGYYKSKKTENSNREELESYGANAKYRLTKDYSVGYYEYYNIQENILNKRGVSLNVDDKCWNLDLRYEKEVVPTSSTLDTSTIQNIVYMYLELKPIGGIKQKYKYEKDKEVE